MNEIRFKVQGSAADPYEVTFIKGEGNNLSAYCTCAAGENGLYCKHRFQILDGITKSIVSSNFDDVKVIQGWLADSDIAETLLEIRTLEAEEEEVKKKLSLAKKRLATAMRN